MSSIDRSCASASAAREALGARTAFLLAGVGTTAWAPLVPLAKTRAALDNGEMAAVLLCLGAGSVIAMLAAGPLYERFGCRKVLTCALIVISLALPCLASASSVPLLVASLLVFGLGLGAMDCSINIWAVAIEKEYGRSVMSGLHGHFSLGGVISPTCISLLLGAGASAVVATCVVSALMLVVLAFVRRLMPIDTESVRRSVLVLPRGAVALLAALCFVVYLAEGAVFDWSAVFLASTRNSDAAHAGYGYVAFSIAMTLCRLAGDSVVRRVGGAWIIAAGGLCAAAGMAMAVLVPGWPAALAGFALLGMGCANLVPVFFTAAGKQRTMPVARAIPAVATVGYAGVLAGPSGIGLIAEVSNLSASLLVVSVMLVGVACCARRVGGIR